MAKVQQKSEKISAFGGIFFVLDRFDRILSSVHKRNSKYVDFVKKCCLCHPNIEIPKDYSSLKEGTIIYPSLRKDLLKDSLDLISKKGITSFDLMNFQEKEWATIAEQMLNWGFCRNKKSVS